MLDGTVYSFSLLSAKAFMAFFAPLFFAAFFVILVRLNKHRFLSRRCRWIRCNRNRQIVFLCQHLCPPEQSKNNCLFALLVKSAQPAVLSAMGQETNYRLHPVQCLLSFSFHTFHTLILSSQFTDKFFGKVFDSYYTDGSIIFGLSN